MNSADYRAKVTIFHPFIDKNRIYLEGFAAASYGKYFSTLNKVVISELIRRHVKEQLFKNYHAGLGYTMGQQDAEYRKISNDNLRYIDSLGQNGIFPGEQNVGILTNQLYDSLKLQYHTLQKYVAREVASWRLPANTEVPFNEESDYFEMGFVYILLFHNANSFATISRYKDDAIRKGQMHPREYASLRYPVANNKTEGMKMCLSPHKVRIDDTRAINELRKQYLLPSYEVDFAKHEFAHEHHLQLNYGMFNGTR